MNSGAIQTRYKGYHFRSRTEARWAVLFDSLHLPYEYEFQGYKLNGTFYLPDFWFPTTKHWAEIKPDNVTREDVNKCSALAVHTQHPCILFSGTPDYWKEYLVMYPQGIGMKRLVQMGYTEEQIWDAIDDSRSARFEHGQCGVT